MSTSVSIIYHFAIVLIVSLAAYAQSDELSRISVKGNKFVTADGKANCIQRT